jgi:hypothetical protein
MSHKAIIQINKYMYTKLYIYLWNTYDLLLSIFKYYTRGGQTFFGHDLLKIYFTFKDQFFWKIFLLLNNYN